MKFDQIECFLKLSETLNFSETALLLGLTQPSVTRKIQAMEESLETNLFIRSKHSVKLTGSGLELLKRIKPLYNEFGALMDHAKDSQKALSGALKIGVLPEIGKNFFCSRFLEFGKKHPELQLQIEYALNHETLPKLMEGKLDFVIVNQLPASELLRSYKIMEERLVMVTRAKNKKFKGTVNKEPFVAYSPHDAILNTYLKSFYKPMDISKITKLSCVNDHSSMIKMLLESDSLAVMPWFSVESKLKTGELVQADQNEKINQFYLVEMNKNYRSKKEQEFRTFLIQNLKSRT